MNFNHFLIILTLIILSVFTLFKESMAQSTTFERNMVTNSFNDGTEAHACDVNQDGWTDFITTGGGSSGQVVWWKNSGYHTFIKHTVDPDLAWARSVCAGDLDEDGDMDIVAAGWDANCIRWYENDGNENWIFHAVDNNFIGAHTVDIKDVDSDGKPDVLCSGFDNSTTYSEIAWWRNNLPDTNWTKDVISTRFQQSPFIYGEDIDNDLDMDILACGELNGEVYWWENDGNQGWTEHMIDEQFPMAHTVFARDIDLDGDFDIIGAACMSSSLAWWENDGNQGFTKHPMGTLAGALWFDATDLDNDGDRDLYAGGQGASKLVWWENNNMAFTKHQFEDTFTQTFSVVHADFNNDDDTDLVAVGHSSNQVAWFDNQLIVPNLYNKPESVVYDPVWDRYLVSNPGGGFVVETDTANNQSYFVHGYTQPCGMCYANGILYASDGDTLFGWSTLNGNEVMALHLGAYNNLDGICYDGSTYLYVIDTWGRIFKVNPEEETFEVLVSSGLPDWPQDCAYDPFEDRIVVAAFQPSAPIVAVDPESGEVTTLTTNSVGRYDGITIDQYGNFYFSTFVSGGRVHKYPHDFSDYYVVASGLGEPTGLYYNQEDDILAIPSFNQHTVHFIQMQQTGTYDLQSDEQIEFFIYPNPATEEATIHFTASESHHISSDIFSPAGKRITNSIEQISQPGINTIRLDLEQYPSGVYFIRLADGTRSTSKKLVIK